MEIQTTRTQTGRQLRNEILARYGSRAGAERAAKKQRHGDAHDALFWLQALEEDPSLLDQEIKTTTIQELEQNEVQLLTRARLQLMEMLVELEQASIMELQRALKRDYKRVQNDVEVLERLGAVRSRKEGSRRIVTPEANALTIRFATRRRPRRPAGRKKPGTKKQAKPGKDPA